MTPDIHRTTNPDGPAPLRCAPCGMIVRARSVEALMDAYDDHCKFVHPGTVRARGPAWVKCSCGETWCRIHRRHRWAKCPCPPFEAWAVDPYTAGGPV